MCFFFIVDSNKEQSFADSAALQKVARDQTRGILRGSHGGG